MTNVIIVASILWALFLALAFGRLWLANRVDGHRPLYICHVTGERVNPRGVGDPVEVQGLKFQWFSCPRCDCNQLLPYQVGYDRQHHGMHLAALDGFAARPVWHGRRTP
jgi:hypothetical protein